jgi:two-component system, chemotaxis family, CheB/CheR fusion protein
MAQRRKGSGRAAQKSDAKRKSSARKPKPPPPARAKPEPKTLVAPRRARRPRRTARSRQNDQSFPVVALGASAGGLEALQQFFSAVPPDSGMAYVVVTHQHPGRVSLLPELLAKHAALEVLSAEDGMRVKRDHAYVAPPGATLAIEGGVFCVKPQDPGETSLPIDHFFRALAHDQGEHAIAIVLSGTASDGVIGIGEIKSAGGMVLAQDSSSARYRGMPESAAATHLVDAILPPEAMPELMLRYVRGRHQTPEPASAGEASGALNGLLVVLRSRTGHDFALYKKSTLRRRIERRMNVHGITSLRDYLRFVQETPQEVDALFKELLISVTNFFRDADAYEALRAELVKAIPKRAEPESPFRAWVPGCATGEEAYSLAILINEVLVQVGQVVAIQIFATDLDQQAVNVARAGRYPAGISADVSAERLERFFHKDEGGYRINKEIRDLIVFASHNVIKDPPFTKLDLLSCRNLLIYIEPESQRRVISLFGYALKPGGLLFLGSSESIAGFDDVFATLSKSARVFERLPVHAAPPAEFPEPPLLSPALMASAMRRAAAEGGPAVQLIAERVLLAKFAPPSVLVNEHGDIVFVHGRTGQFLEPAAGQPSNNISAMAREGLRLELPAALRQAATEAEPIVRRGLQVKANGGFIPATLRVQRLQEPEPVRGLFLVSFEAESGPQPQKNSGRDRSRRRHASDVAALELELKHNKENLQGMIEELETSNEELKSTNEELQSTNEELQSANEELETSREEMQSLNEELQTVNSELEERNRALSRAKDDLQNLLNSTDVATVFLDDKLIVQRFTTQARKVFSLIDTDIGRPISDLAANLRYEELVEDCHDVLRTLQSREREVQTRDGAWRQMRIMPYRTGENVIDGLVMTFVDIDGLKREEQAAQLAGRIAEIVEDTVPLFVLVLDGELHVRRANKKFCETFRTTEKSVVGEPLHAIVDGLLDQPELLERLETLSKDGRGFDGLPLDARLHRFGEKNLSIGARRLSGADSGQMSTLLVIRDVTGQGTYSEGDGE